MENDMKIKNENINMYGIVSLSEHSKHGDYNSYSLDTVKRLIKRGQQLSEKYDNFTKLMYNESLNFGETKFIGIGFDNPTFNTELLKTQKFLRIGEPAVDSFGNEYLASYNHGGDYRENGVSVVTSSWLKSMKSVFFVSSDEKLASRGVYEIEGIDLNFQGGDDETLIYPTSWAKKTNIKSRKKLETVVKYLEEHQKSSNENTVVINDESKEETKINERRKNNMAEIKYPISKTKYSDKEIISAINVVHKIFDTERLSLNVIEHPSEKPFVDELRFNIVGSQGLNLSGIENETFDDLASAINRITLSTDNYDEKLVSLLNSDYFTELLSTIDAATYTDYVHTSFGKYYNTTQDRLKENEEIDELSFLIDVGLETSINKMATKTQVYLPETKYPIKKYDKGGHIIYSETKDGYWQKWTYDKNGNNTYWEDSSGNWGKQEYDSNNNRTYYADSTGKTEQTKQSMKDKLAAAQTKAAEKNQTREQQEKDKVTPQR